MKKRITNDKRGFTLFEVVTTVGVLFFLAGVGLFSYMKIVDNARREVCETNLKVLNTAVEMYSQEYGVVPAVLGHLDPQHLQKAYARVMENSSWQTRFSLALHKITPSGEAHAEFLKYDNLKKFGAAQDSFSCPSDDNGGTSYGINANIDGKPWFSIGNDVVIIADCDTPTFTSASQLKARHGSGNVAVSITKGGTVASFGDDVEENEDATFDVDPSTDPDPDPDPDPANVYDAIQEIFDANPGTPLADKMEDVLNKLSDASIKLDDGDGEGAVGAIEGAIGDLQAAIDDGLLDSTLGQGFIDDLMAQIDEINSTI